mmetsp:Transcript_13492/g.38345  ORF Transcript_13492/g.38345 Transcript_13492/m.38345 type:complete len:347 (+) Transcript_13492:46-1086(+)
MDLRKAKEITKDVIPHRISRGKDEEEELVDANALIPKLLLSDRFDWRTVRFATYDELPDEKGQFVFAVQGIHGFDKAERKERVVFLQIFGPTMRVGGLAEWKAYVKRADLMGWGGGQKVNDEGNIFSGFGNTDRFFGVSRLKVDSPQGRMLGHRVNFVAKWQLPTASASSTKHTLFRGEQKHGLKEIYSAGGALRTTVKSQSSSISANSDGRASVVIYYQVGFQCSQGFFFHPAHQPAPSAPLLPANPPPSAPPAVYADEGPGTASAAATGVDSDSDDPSDMESNIAPPAVFVETDANPEEALKRALAQAHVYALTIIRGNPRIHHQLTSAPGVFVASVVVTCRYR